MDPRRDPRDDIETLILSFERQGWVVMRGETYYKARCACESKHWKLVHVRSRASSYGTNVRRKLRRDTCWVGALA